MSQSDSSVHYEIQHNPHLNQDYFVFTIDPLLPISSEGNSYCLYINYSENIAPDSFVWDYFSTGELYINIPKNKTIEYARDTFRTLFKNYFLKPQRLGNPAPVGTKPFDFVTSVSSPSSPNIQAWMFEISKFFSLKDTSSKIPVASSPICSYLTINDPGKSFFIKSDSYIFANVPDNSFFCSCPSIIGQLPYASCAPYALLMPMNKCSGYNPKTTLLESKIVTLDNTTNFFTLILEYSLSSQLTHQFNISSVTQDKEVNLVFSLDYPLTEDYDKLLQSATEVYNTFLVNYTNATTSDSIKISQEDNIPDQSKEVNSYIFSLLSVQ